MICHSDVMYCHTLTFRLAGGEPMIHLPPLIKYPWYSEEDAVQLFPFRTLSMLLSMVSLLGISEIAW